MLYLAGGLLGIILVLLLFRRRRILKWIGILAVISGAGFLWYTQEYKPQSLKVYDPETNLITEQTDIGEIVYRAGELTVQFRSGVIDFGNEKAKTQLESWGAEYGLKLDETLSAMRIGYFTFDGTQRKLESIKKKVLQDSRVTRAIWNHQIKLNNQPTAPSGNLLNDPASIPSNSTQWYEQQWYLHFGTQIAEAWKYISETKKPLDEVIVAVIDTGIDLDHPDLRESLWDGSNCKDHEGNPLNNCRGGYDFFARDKDPSHEYKTGTQDDHGTHVAGIIGMKHGNSLGGAGVAPNVKIMALKVSGASGNNMIDESAVQRAIGFAIQNGADILNLSYGATFETCEGEYEAWFSLMRNIYSRFRGLIVTAAGNDNREIRGPNRVTFPASYAHQSLCFSPLPNMISIGATDQEDKRAIFGEGSGSNYGDVTMMAPGYWIFGPADPRSPNRSGANFASASGTSQATPLFAGIAALVKGFSPSVSTSVLKEILISSGNSLNALRNITVSGKRVNALKAIESLPLLQSIRQSGEKPEELILRFSRPIIAKNQPIISWNNQRARYKSGTGTSNLIFTTESLPPTQGFPYQLRVSSGSLADRRGVDATLMVKEFTKIADIIPESEQQDDGPVIIPTRETSPVRIHDSPESSVRIIVPQQNQPVINEEPTIQIDCDQRPHTQTIEYPSANNIDGCQIIFDPGDIEIRNLSDVRVKIEDVNSNPPDANTQTSFHEGLQLFSPRRHGDKIYIELRALAPSLDKYGSELACLSSRLVDIVIEVPDPQSTPNIHRARKRVALRFDPMHTVNPVEPDEIILPGAINLELDHHASTGAQSSLPTVSLHTSLLPNPSIFNAPPRTPVELQIDQIPGLDNRLYFHTKVRYDIAGKTISYPAGYLGPQPTQISDLGIGRNESCSKLIGTPAPVKASLIGAQIEGSSTSSRTFEDISIFLNNPLSESLGASQFREDMRKAVWPYLNTETIPCPRGKIQLKDSDEFEALWGGSDTAVIENCEVQIGGPDRSGLIPKIRIRSGKQTLFVRNGNLKIDANMIYQDTNDSLGIVLINDKVDGYPAYGNIFVHPNVREFVGTYFIDGAMFGYDGTDNPVQQSGRLNLGLIWHQEDKNNLNRRQLVLNGNIISNNTLGGFMVKHNDLDLNTPYFSAWEQQTSPLRAVRYDLHYIRRFDEHGDQDYCRRQKNGTCDENSMAFIIRNDRRGVYATPPGFEGLSNRSLTK